MLLPVNIADLPAQHPKRIIIIGRQHFGFIVIDHWYGKSARQCQRAIRIYTYFPVADAGEHIAQVVPLLRLFNY